MAVVLTFRDTNNLLKKKKKERKKEKGKPRLCRETGIRPGSGQAPSG